MKLPELLSPAGSLKNMEYAFAYGADAVYAGQPRYSLRVRENEFNKIENLAKGVARAHELGKLIYIASNISPHNDKVKTYLKDMEDVIAMKPDALIMSDPGLIMMVREKWPDMPVHLSVQANAVNWATVKFWHQQGLSRVILSRELSLDEIAEIKQRVPEMELEVFVHGALCIAYSGRCLLSGYMTHRDSNQGACTNSCRWKYNTHKAEQSEGGEIIPLKEITEKPVELFDPTKEPESDDGLDRVSPMYLLEEQGRPGELMPAYEDEHGTYIMNSKDLRAVQHVKRLMEIGVDSLKIEGRTKSYYYAARTAQVYKRAILDAAEGKEFDFQLMDDLEGMANRGFTEGFYRRHVPSEYQNYETGNSTANTQLFVGDIQAVNTDDQSLTIEVKNRFEVGQKLELLTPVGNFEFTLTEMINAKNGKPLDAALGTGYTVKIQWQQIPGLIVQGNNLEKGLLVKNVD